MKERNELAASVQQLTNEVDEMKVQAGSYELQIKKYEEEAAQSKSLAETIDKVQSELILKSNEYDALLKQNRETASHEAQVLMDEITQLQSANNVTISFISFSDY